MKRGHIRPQGQNSWAVVIDLGRDPLTGKRQRKWHTVRGSRKDAQRFLTDLLRQVDTGAYSEPSKMTLGQYLEQWLRDYAAASVRPTTYESYVLMVRKHIIPAIGHIPLAKLTPMHLQRLYSEKLRGGRADGQPGGLSPRSVRYIHTVLREALDHAVKWQLVGRNVAEATQPPRLEQKEIQALTQEQALVFLETVKEDRLYPLYLMALTTGMRRGELLGLRWEDVDLEKGAATIRQTLTRISNRGWVVQSPKTDRSRRSVALPPMVVQALRRHRARQAEEKLFFGPEYQDYGLVFTAPQGGPIDPRNLLRQFKKALARAGLPDLRFHDVRHTHATLLLHQGIHPKVVSERLGHSRTGITLDTYSHVVPGMQEEAARKIEEVLSRKRKT